MPTIRTKQFPDRPKNNIDENTQNVIDKNILRAIIGSPAKLNTFAVMKEICREPFNIEYVYDKLDILIEEIEINKEISYILTSWNAKCVVWINAVCSNNRKRYALTNALYYYAKQKKGGQPICKVCGIFFCGEVITDKEQILAGKYTRELLMPEKAFRECLNSGNTSIHGLSKLFGVPTLAIRFRAKELGMYGHGL